MRHDAAASGWQRFGQRYRRTPDGRSRHQRTVPADGTPVHSPHGGTERDRAERNRIAVPLGTDVFACRRTLRASRHGTFRTSRSRPAQAPHRAATIHALSAAPRNRPKPDRILRPRRVATAPPDEKEPPAKPSERTTAGRTVADMFRTYPSLPTPHKDARP